MWLGYSVCVAPYLVVLVRYSQHKMVSNGIQCCILYDLCITYTDDHECVFLYFFLHLNLFAYPVVYCSFVGNFHILWLCARPSIAELHGNVLATAIDGCRWSGRINC